MHADPFPAPGEIRLASVDSSVEADSPGRNITFNWTSVHENCLAIHYAITDTNCGTCPDTVKDTQAMCNNIVITGLELVCSFAVNTVACGSIVASPSSSASIRVALKGIYL